MQMHIKCIIKNKIFKFKRFFFLFCLLEWVQGWIGDYFLKRIMTEQHKNVQQTPGYQAGSQKFQL